MSSSLYSDTLTTPLLNLFLEDCHFTFVPLARVEFGAGWTVDKAWSLTRKYLNLVGYFG
jgi:hypothetical protein